MTKRGVDARLFDRAKAWSQIRLFCQHVCSFEVTKRNEKYLDGMFKCFFVIYKDIKSLLYLIKIQLQK